MRADVIMTVEVIDASPGENGPTNRIGLPDSYGGGRDSDSMSMTQSSEAQFSLTAKYEQT